MKTIGEIIKEARVRRKYSLARLEEKTKIKKEFIENIEEEKWQKLPEYPVISGFVKSLAAALEIESEMAAALLRRDYPPKTLPINPKPDVSKEFRWSPKLTFIVAVALVIILILGYLGFQYIDFVSPPRLTVSSPEENETVTTSQVLVEGTTDANATLEVNNQPVLVNEDGSFLVELEIDEETREITIKAVSRSGKEMVVQRRIIQTLEP